MELSFLFTEAKKRSQYEFVETFAVKKRAKFSNLYLKFLQEKAIEVYLIPKKLVGSGAPEWEAAFSAVVEQYEKPLKTKLLEIRKQDLINADQNERLFLSSIWEKCCTR